jgi:quinoprotein glucose dehydrogenase
MSRTLLRITLLCLVLGVALTSMSPPLQGQAGTRDGEWRHYGGDTGHTRYAPLDQINASNFNSLEIAWRFKTDALGPRPEYNLESTPLMVGGRLYSTGGTRRAVVALDAATGELLWMHSEHEGARAAAAPRQLSGRGLAYWSDGKEERILYVTPGYRLVALDAKTGQPVPGFGRNGIVDLKQDFDQELDLEKAPVGLHSTPMIAKNVVIVGAAFATGANPKSKENVKGYVRGFDVRTGKRIWIFHTIPRPGEFGFETWKEDSWKYTGNTGVWAQISIDEQLGLAYLPVELPTHDYFGANRPGDNLFAESIVAVELETGKRRWHYQLVHHGMWDMDIPSAPILADITINGKTVKALAQTTKQALLYVFNRETGEPIWPIIERPVPIGDTPGEWYSPTQPIPTKPAPYDGTGLTVDDLIDFTPELRAEAVKLVSRYRIGPMFTPPVVSRAEGPIATLTMGAQAAASNWPGGSYDPETHTLYVASQTSVATLGLVPPPPGSSDMAYHQGTVLAGPRTTGGSGAGAGAAGTASPAAGGEGGAGPPLTVQGLPLIKPPYSRITAINMDTGDFRWQVPFGATPDNIRNHPALKGLNLPAVMGRPGNNPGTLVTKTLLIAGEKNYGPTPSGQRGAMLRALDKLTGKEVGAIPMPAPQSGSPMTYMLNGRQYLVVAISGGNYSGELVAFRLPSPAPAATTAADTYPATGGDIAITPLLHSSIQLEHGGKVVQVDPWSVADLSKAKPADLILITDDPVHHLDPKAIQQLRKPGAPIVIPPALKARVPDGVVLANGASTTVAGVRVESIAAYDLTPGAPEHPKGQASGYLITLGGRRIYVAGVTECVPELLAVTNVDVAFMPMNIPPARMTPSAAADCVKRLKPKAVYVNHYDQDTAGRLTNPKAVPRGLPGGLTVPQSLQAFKEALRNEPIDVRLPDWYSGANSR